MGIIKLGEISEAVSLFEGFNTISKTDAKSSKIRIATATYKSTIDISWLPAASSAYNVSDDIRDYVFVEIPIVTASFPNRNMDCFPEDEVMKFDLRSGRAVYQTFIGKPTHKDHDNKDPLKAKGANFDAKMVKLALRGREYNKIKILSGWDRTKDAELVQEILDRKRSRYSMGAWVDETRCSICGQPSKSGQIRCHKKGQVIGGVLCYETCHGICYIENSSVLDPADVDAEDGGIK